MSGLQARRRRADIMSLTLCFVLIMRVVFENVQLIIVNVMPAAAAAAAAARDLAAAA